MPRATQYQNTFASGEFRPDLEGRVDIERYASAVKTLKHFTCTTPGGAKRRSGTHYVAEVKNSATRVRLIEFEFSDTQAYVLEFGEKYLRFYMNEGQILTSNLVPNGTFDTDISSWGILANGFATVTWVDGRMRLFGGTGGAVDLAQAKSNTAFDLVVPAPGTYTVTFTVATNPITLRIGTTHVAGDILAETSYGVGSHAVEFTTPGTVFHLRFAVTDDVEAFLDDVSVLSGAPYEIATPYSAADLPRLKHVQSADVMYLVHPEYPPHKLTRTGHAEWTLRPVTFLPPPTAEEPITPAATLTPSAITGNGVTFTASAAVFLNADIDRHILFGASRAVIQTFTSTTVVVADILDAFPDTNPIPSGSWSLNGSPSATLDPDKKEPRGTTVTLTAGVAAFRAADVGKYLKLHDGLVRITTFTSSTSVKGELVKVLSEDGVAAGGTWTLEVAAWSASRGYPAAITFHEGRLVFGGTFEQPQTLWGSESGDFEELALGTDPADAYEFGIAANKVNNIRWLLPGRVLLVGTKGGEFRITGGLDQAITPTNVDAKSETTYGSNFVPPVRVGASVLFVQRSGRKVRELAFSLDLDAYVAPDLTVLAAHLLPQGTTIAEMAFQQDPEPILWAVRSDGLLLSLTYDRSNNVVGWAQHPLDGAVESVCVIPHPDGDREQAWLAVKRTINGQTKRYVEFIDDGNGFYTALGLDCALTYTGSPATTFAGLEHLRGKVVGILGDGAYYGQQTVPVSGAAEVTISPAASQVEIGLPYTGRIETLRAEVPTEGGTGQGRKKRLSQWAVRVVDTMGLTINGHVQPARRSSDLLGDPPTLFTGDYDGSTLGWDKEGRTVIEAPLPFPATILGIIGTMDVADLG